jgi:PIN domain nuclease of toxin-antitoxin system
VKLLLDTHLLLWAAGNPQRLSANATTLISNLENKLHYSVASLWEIAIKKSLGREDFRIDTRRLQRMLQAHGYHELSITGEHAIATEDLPAIHKDPFDRILLAQARSEALTFLTSDETLAKYGGEVHLV